MSSIVNFMHIIKSRVINALNRAAGFQQWPLCPPTPSVTRKVLFTFMQRTGNLQALALGERKGAGLSLISCVLLSSASVSLSVLCHLLWPSPVLGYSGSVFGVSEINSVCCLTTWPTSLFVHPQRTWEALDCESRE